MASANETTQCNLPEMPKQGSLIDEYSFLSGAVRNLVQTFLHEEMTAFLGAKRYQRSPTRQGYRSGVRPRTLNTRVGRLHFEVPCERSGRFRSKLFARYQRSEQAFLLALQEMYLRGVSTRKVRKVTEQLCELPISASSVARATARLDAELTSWRNRPLNAEYAVIIVDARYERARNGDRVTSQAVLTVSGVLARTGQREILAVQLANAQSAASWGDVFRDLWQRGVRGVRL
ncbi:MAG: transposase, partial [candidate division WOR-3 bacterium]